MSLPPLPQRTGVSASAQYLFTPCTALLPLLLLGQMGCGRVGIELLPGERVTEEDAVVRQVDAGEPSACEPSCEPTPDPPDPPLCSGAECAPGCSPGLADCDGLADNGCETALSSDPQHCGACDRVCDASAPLCAQGSCQSPSCTPGSPGCGPLVCETHRADCDAASANGCEADLQSSSAHCGGCGAACSNAHGNTSCVAASCVPVCDASFGDCDSDKRNGCETGLTSIEHCGGCGQRCSAGNGEVALCGASGCETRCALSGSYAVRLSLPTSWPSTAYLASGSGNFTFWGLLRLTQSGNELSGTVINCGELVPDFRAMPLINERYGVTYPDALFDRTPLPGVAARATVSDTRPGASFTLARTAFVTGATLADPVNDAWPSRGSLNSLDSDGDGKPGLSVPYKSGNGYSLPPGDTLGSTRAQTGYLAARLVFSLRGTLDSCTASSGTLSAQSVEARTLGCRVQGGSRDCSTGEADHLDENCPRFAADPGTYTLVKLTDSATCAMARAALP